METKVACKPLNFMHYSNKQSIKDGAVVVGSRRRNDKKIGLLDAWFIRLPLKFFKEVIKLGNWIELNHWTNECGEVIQTLCFLFTKSTCLGTTNDHPSFVPMTISLGFVILTICTAGSIDAVRERWIAPWYIANWAFIARELAILHHVSVVFGARVAIRWGVIRAIWVHIKASWSRGGAYDRVGRACVTCMLAISQHVGVVFGGRATRRWVVVRAIRVRIGTAWCGCWRSKGSALWGVGATI